MNTLIRSIRSLSFIIPIALCALATPAKADTTLYSNGTPSGSINAWAINHGFTVQDSFNLSSTSSLTGVTFANWLISGDSASQVEWLITDTLGGSTPVCGDCSGTATLTPDGSFTISLDSGYNGVIQTFSLPDISLAAGTYYLQLENEITNNGDPAYWDENDGSSQAWQSGTGDIGSESFTIVGTAGTTPEPGSLALLGSGLAFVGTEIRRRRSAKR